MYQQADIQKLTAKLHRLEAELAAIRKEIAALPEQQPKPTMLREATPAYLWSDKTLLKEQFAKLLANLDIKGEPIGAEALQQRMHQVGLEPNELSQTIIAMRNSKLEN
ncbi:MAG: hypothetical protein IPJ90_10130 [Anaerolineaceae bacterium]|nr:hypothetical protein [Anaerolineaceae bacterium]